MGRALDQDSSLNILKDRPSGCRSQDIVSHLQDSPRPLGRVLSRTDPCGLVSLIKKKKKNPQKAVKANGNKFNSKGTAFNKLAEATCYPLEK